LVFKKNDDSTMTKQGFISLALLTTLFSCNEKNTGSSGSSALQQATTTGATTDDITITDLSPVSEDYKFPVVHFSKNKAAEEKVNTYLQLEELEHLPGVFKKNPFENVMPHEESLSGTTSFYSWTRNTTTPNVLSLSQEAESVGAYPEGFTSYHNFDARTGNAIDLDDIFTKDGLNALCKTLNQQVKKTIEDYLAELNKSGQDTGYSQEEKDEQIGMYQSCLEGVLDYNMEYYSFYFSGDSVVFERGRCSNHAMRALDDLDKYTIPMAFSTVKQYLTHYGENLIFNSDKPIGTLTPKHRLYKGFINSMYPIRAMISTINGDGSFTMQYWYEKTKTPIEWSGTFKNNHFSLREGDAFQVEADWKENKKIIGTWTDLKTKHAMKLELEAY
jgi:hypothetical protein